MKNIERRGFLKWVGLTSVAAIAANRVQAAENCHLTPAETSGPFYPGQQVITERLDLTRAHLKNAI